MTKTARNSAAATEEAFHKHYAAIWGDNRWRTSLYPALATPTRQCALVNRYVPARVAYEYLKSQVVGQELERVPLPSIGGESQIECLAASKPQEGEDDNASAGQISPALPPPRMAAIPGTQQRRSTHWNLDGASVLAAQMLNVRPNDDVLDLCAAPGGKSITVAQNIWPQLHVSGSEGAVRQRGPKPGHLTCNELDGARQNRLTENLKAYLPSELFTSNNIRSLRIDCADPLAHRKLSIGGAGYDKVLVDAPCSSERHIIHAHLAAQAGGRIAPEMANWRPGSSKRLSKTQTELLMTGIKAAKVGGSVLYATCSIEPSENDGVIEKMLATIEKELKKGQKWTVAVGFNSDVGDPEVEAFLEREWAERTKHGWIVLPDHPGGGKWGPLFFVMLTKVAVDGR